MGTLVTGADPETFHEMDYDGEVSDYSEDAAHVYYVGQLIPGADPFTFTLLDADNNYAKDRTHVYYEGYQVVEADPNTFAVWDANDEFAKDASHVFEGGQIFPGADPNTFVIIDDSSGGMLFAKDRRHVYMPSQEGPLPGADPATFIPIYDPNGDGLGTGYFKDKNYVYLVSPTTGSVNRVPGADPDTFILLNTVEVWRAEDKTRYYVNGQDES